MKRAAAKRIVATRPKARGMGRTSKPVATLAVPALPKTTGASGVSGAKAGFMDASDGRSMSLAWARYSIPFGFGYGFNGPYAVSYASRERRDAAAVANDLVTSNPTVATIVETLTTQLVGTGLTLSAKVDAKATGLTEEQARVMSTELEGLYRAWARDPLACDVTGRNTVDEMAATNSRNWLLYGEGLTTLDWRIDRGSRFGTKVSLLDPRQLASDWTRSEDAYSAREGVVFDTANRLAGYYIRPLSLSATVQVVQPQFVEARTPWGRQKVIHLFEPLAAGQVRGISPIAAALSPSQEKRTLKEFTLAAALVQTQWAATVTSAPIRGADPHASIKTADDIEPTVGSGTDLAKWSADRATFYKDNPIAFEPGRVAHLLPNDKLEVVRSDTPNRTYEPFDRSMTREAARASGESYETVSGDFSMTNFSASRMAAAIPHRVMMRRRRMIVERWYQSVYAAFCEEAIEAGHITLPPNAKPFHQAVAGYTTAEWRGLGMVQADPKRAAEADLLELENGLATYEQKLAERGLDLEDTIAARKREKELLEAAGLPGFVGVVTKQVRTQDEPDDDARPARRPIEEP